MACLHEGIAIVGQPVPCPRPKRKTKRTKRVKFRMAFVEHHDRTVGARRCASICEALIVQQLSRAIVYENF